MEKRNNVSKSNTSYRPEGSHTITPYLILKDASEFIDFAKKAFDVKVESRTDTDDGQILNANLTLGDSSFMIGEQMRGMDVQNSMLYLYVKDADALFRQAVNAGAKQIREVKDEFYGDRCGCVKDKWGNTWWIATHIEDVSESELSKRAKKAMSDDMKKQKPEMTEV